MTARRWRRAAQRVVGCGMGGAIGLLLLALPIAHGFVPWLLLLMGGAGVGMQVQSGRQRVGYVGNQAFILTLVQGPGPPATLAPAMDRLAGMLGAMVLMLIATLLLRPSPKAAAPVPMRIAYKRYV